MHGAARVDRYWSLFALYTNLYQCYMYSTLEERGMVAMCKSTLGLLCRNSLQRSCVDVMSCPPRARNPIPTPRSERIKGL